jgi:dTDP-glucose 4,6-dehydratase
MKILVTGGAGFIGTNFVHYILDKYENDEVVNLDALTYAGNLENLKRFEDDPRHTFVKGDICDEDLVNRLVKDVDAVVHFAAESHVDRSIKGGAEFVRTNVTGTHTLLEAAKAHDVRFHHVSTDEVFGDLEPDDSPFNEETPYNPRNPYSASKAASDHFVRSYYHTHGLPITISNCSNNYGPWQFPEKLIPLFVSNLKEGEQVPVYGDGKQVRDWIHVGDHVRGVDKVLREGEIGETYCFGGDAEMENIEITRMLVDLLDREESAITYVKDRPGHDRRYAIDFSKAKRELGWEPKHTFKDGLKQTVEWYLSHQDWVERCKSGDYKKYYEKHYEGQV